MNPLPPSTLLFDRMFSSVGTIATTVFFTSVAPAVLYTRQDIMGHVVNSASPYLYPCTIQYSLIAAGGYSNVVI